MDEIEKLWSEAFSYLPSEIKEQTRQGWKGALIYRISTNQFRRSQLSYFSLLLGESKLGIITVAVAPLVGNRARQLFGEPVGYL